MVLIFNKIYLQYKSGILSEIRRLPLFLIGFLFGNVRISCKVSAAISSAVLIAWAYILAMVAVLACPSRLDTVVILTFFAINKLAFVCRNE